MLSPRHDSDDAGWTGWSAYEVDVLKLDFAADRLKGEGFQRFGHMVITVKDIFESVQGGFGSRRALLTAPSF